MHIGPYILGILASVAASYLLACFMELRKWMKHYHGGLDSAWAVTFRSEARLSLILRFIGALLISGVCWVIYFLCIFIHFLGVRW